ncbi:MAG: thioesterase family protein [Trueperaceae bacterium]
MIEHVTPVEVRFGDTDMFGHVNNAAFATYLESARLAFFRDRLSGTLESPGGEAGGIILARLAIDFRKQLLFGASAQVTTGVERIGRTSIALKQELFSEGAVVAQADSVVVVFDYEQQCPAEVPVSVRRKLGFDS